MGKEPIPKDRKLGEILVSMGFISELQLAEAMATQAELNGGASNRRFKIGEVLLFKKAIQMNQLHEALRAQTSKASSIRKDIQVMVKKAELIKALSDDHDRLGQQPAKDNSRKTLLGFLSSRKASK